MVVTRSRVLNQGEDTEEKAIRRNHGGVRRNFVITIAPKARRKPPSVRIQDTRDNKNDNNDDGGGDGDDEEEEGSSSAEDGEEDSSSSGVVEEKSQVTEEDDEEDEEDEEFDLPDCIRENVELRGMAEDVIQSIKEHSPSLEMILRADVREKHKAELFEWFMVYDNTMPMSEDRMALRKQVYRMLEDYKREYVEYKKHEEDVVQFEKSHEHHNDLSDMQYAILRLETTETHKQILFRKYCELKERDDMDEEFYKLKGWLKQALQLPFDRIKNFPRFDNVTEQLLHVKSIFDTELYGMEKVKEQLLLFIHGKIMNPDMRGCCLGLVGEPGVGKCLHPMTPVMLHDGSIQPAHSLVKGDVLMGDDSGPRVIKSVCTGEQLMYRVVQENGDPYIVNSSHILTLFSKTSGSLQDMEITEYLRLPKNRRDEFCGVKTGVSFPSTKLTFPLLPVRMMGYLWASQMEGSRFPVLSSDIGTAREDGLWTVTSVELSRFLEKHFGSMPSEFKINSVEVRTKFLKGVLDAGAPTSRLDPDEPCNVFLPPPRRADFLFLARSLGLAASWSPVDKCILLCDSPLDEQCRPKIPLVTYGIEVEELDVDKYVGFIVDGNHRFLLGDFTITHNTSIARCLAKVLEFPFEQISFGGVHHSDFIKGFDFTYVGSRPGEIARCLTRMGHKNGIIFFDEYEKVSDNPEITSTLLHITDFSQNNGFRDNFFNELTIDLSSVWFIYSMNDLPKDKALKDRIYSIEVEGYSEKEKVRIASDYLFPKSLGNIGKTRSDVLLSDEVVGYLVQKVCGGEKGIRNLEKAVRDVLNKVHFLVTNQNKLPCSYMLPDSYFPLAFPVTLTKTMVDVFLKGFITAPRIPNFYV